MEAEPLPRVARMKAMVARHAESQETGHEVLLLVRAKPLGRSRHRRSGRHRTARRRVRHPKPLHADAAARQMAAALETGDSGRGPAAGEGMVVGRMGAFVGRGVVCFGFAARERSFAVGASEGDLARWGGNGDAAGRGPGQSGGLHVEADAGVVHVPGLDGVAVRFFPVLVTRVGHVARAGEGHCEGGGLDVVGSVDVVLEEIYGLFGQTGQHDPFQVASSDGGGRGGVQILCECAVRQMHQCNSDSIAHRK